ncbi:MAG TPA: hypothetical protein VHN14_23320 [Kofleriaceae bacterium]|jgi:hypothetical protein|nr:hypothetical protein [Kofleriaceae bacterium]
MGRSTVGIACDVNDGYPSRKRFASSGAAKSANSVATRAEIPGSANHELRAQLAATR